MPNENITDAPLSPSAPEVLIWVAQTLKKLLPNHCGVGVRTMADPRNHLLGDEPSLVLKAVQKRKDEFTAGRCAARDALKQIGAEPRPILAHADRSPQWPTGIAGSISHAGDLGIAAVSSKLKTTALGIDLERVTGVTEEIWSRILIESELRFLRALPHEQHVPVASLFFSVKEAFYKCQHPLTGEWIDFTDVEATLDLAANKAKLKLLKAIKIPGVNGTVIPAQFMMGHGYVVSTVWIEGRGDL